MVGSWDGPGRDCPGVDGTTVLLTIVLCRFCICTASLGDTTRVALSRTFAPECPGRRRLSKWPGEWGRWVRSLRRGERERRLRSWLQTSVIPPTRMEPAFRPVLSQSVDTATARATARGPGNSLLIHFSPLQDWLSRSHYILNGLKARRRKALYRLAIELLQGTLRLPWKGSSERVCQLFPFCQSLSSCRCSRCPRCQWYNQTGVPTRTATMLLMRLWTA